MQTREQFKTVTGAGSDTDTLVRAEPLPAPPRDSRMSTFRWVSALLGAFTTLVALPLQGQAVTLVSTLGQEVGVQQTMLHPQRQWRATKFTIGPDSGYTLRSVVVKRGSGGQTINMAIHAVDTNNTDNPASAALYSFTAPSSNASGNRTFTAPSGATLTQDTSYFVVMTTGTSSAQSMSLIKPVALIKRTSADRGTFTTGLATQIQGPASGDSAWSDESVGTPITPVPALVLAGIGLLGLLLALFGPRAGLNDRRRALVALACLAPIVGLSLPVAAQAQTKVPSDWSLIPAGINPGDSFRLIFGSSTERNGTSTDIATYNTWIQARAAAGHTAIRAYSSGFRVVASTSTVDARDNTGTTYTSADKGVPIYWLGGSKVADDYEDFYDGSWDNEANPKNESGSSRDLSGTNDHPMTGSTHAGTKSSGFALGSNSVILGKPNSSASADGPLSSNNATAKTNTRAFYGLSAVFTVKRPPAALSIADASAAENAGHLLFDVTLSRSLPNTVKVDFETISGGTATEGVDYHARRTYTHVIVAGDRTAQMGFALIEDTVNDADETVEVRLSNARQVDAYGDKIADLDITTDEATGTITAPATTTTNVSNLNIRIQDASADEDDGWLDFRVRLSRKYDDYVCYDFETISGGTATEGRDYSKRPKVGQWVQIGKRVDKPFVRIIDDAINDDGETVKVKISNARLCNDASKTVSIANAEATGTINNSDPMPLAWMVRFGRTVGSQVVDALGQRLDGGTASHVTVGGINLTGAPGAAPEAQSDDPFGLPEWAKGTQREESEQSLTANELLLGNAFHLSSGGGQGEGPAYTAWGRVARSGFEAEVDDVTMDADVTSGLIGFDAEWERVLAGVMLSQSSGEGSYRLDPQKGDDAGTVKSSLSGVYPYVQLDLNATVSAWALAGAGSGDLTLHQDDAKTHAYGHHDAHGRGRGEGPSARRHRCERARDEREIRRHVGRDEERTHDRSDRQRRQRQPTAAHRRGQAHLRGRQRGEDHPKRRAGASPRRRRRGDRHRARDGRGVELRRGAAYRRRPGADAGRARGVRIRGVGRERGDAHHAQHVRPGTDAQHRA